MEHKSFKNVLDNLDYVIVDYNNTQFFGIKNLGTIHEYLSNKQDGEYELPYTLWQFNYIIESNFKFNDDEIKAEYIKLRKQLIKWFVECNTQDENGNDDVDIIEKLYFYTI